MSLVAERPKTRRQSAATTATRRRKAGVAKPVSRTRPRPVRRPRTGTLAMSLMMVACMCAFTFVTSSVVGNTMLENARRDRIRSVERAKEGREEVARLRRVLNSMTSMESVDRFASANGMVLSGVELPANAPAPSAPSAESRSIVAAASPSSLAGTTVVAMANDLASDTRDGAEAR